MSNSTCCVDGCPSWPQYAGWCKAHYDPLLVIVSRCEVSDGDCWLYTGPGLPSGYGRLGRTLTHRLAWESSVELVPDGLQLDHLCRNRRCFNPDHLEVVTNQENARRGVAARPPATQCPAGHPRSSENLSVRSSDGANICKACARERARRLYYKKRGRPLPGTVRKYRRQITP